MNLKLPCIDNAIRILHRASFRENYTDISCNLDHYIQAHTLRTFSLRSPVYRCMRLQCQHKFQWYRLDCTRTEHTVLLHWAILHKADSNYWCIFHNWFQSSNSIWKEKEPSTTDRKLYSSRLLYRAVETNTASTINAICVNTHATLIDLWIIIAFVGMSIAL